MSDSACPYCFAPLPKGKRHSCVPLRGRVHPTNAFYFNDNGKPKLMRLHKGATVPRNESPSGGDRPLSPAAGLPQTFVREAATIAIE